MRRKECGPFGRIRQKRIGYERKLSIASSFNLEKTGIRLLSSLQSSRVMIQAELLVSPNTYCRETFPHRHRSSKANRLLKKYSVAEGDGFRRPARREIAGKAVALARTS